MPEAPYRLIPLRRRDGTVCAHATVDIGDLDWLNQHRWSLRAQGYAARTAKRGGKEWAVAMHRAILGLELGDPRQVDHINGNRLDNRRANLRVVTNAENGQNRTSLQARNISGYRGVTWYAPRRKWRAKVTLARRQYTLGYFDDVHEAGRIAAAFRAANMPFSSD